MGDQARDPEQYALCEDGTQRRYAPRGNPFVKGNLYILFKVIFPDDGDLGPEAIATLRSILPNPDMEVEYDAEEVEELHMSAADVKNLGKGGAEQGGDRAYDSDDEEGGGNLQCQQS